MLNLFLYQTPQSDKCGSGEGLLDKVVMMKKLITVLLIAGLACISIGKSSYAGHRYYGNHHGWHHGGYKHYKHHRHSSYHYHSSDYIWATLGIGLLTGILINAITTPPPPPRTVVYTTPPQVIVKQSPEVVYYERTYSPMPPAQRELETILRKVVVDAKLLNVRQVPDPQSTVITRLQFGTVVGVIGAAPEWLYIKTANGQYGWVMSQYTIDATTASPVG